MKFHTIAVVEQFCMFTDRDFTVEAMRQLGDDEPFSSAGASIGSALDRLGQRIVLFPPLSVIGPSPRRAERPASADLPIARRGLSPITASARRFSGT